MPPGLDLAAVSDALKALSAIGQLVPMAGGTISGALDLASQICDIVQEAKDNKQGIQRLAIDAGVSLVEITKIIQTAEETKQPEYERHVEELNKLLRKIKEMATDINNRGVWTRVWSRRKVKQTIADLDDQLANARANFGVYEALRSQITQDSLVNMTADIVNHQHETLAAVKKTQITAEKAAERALLDKLSPVAAGWNSDAVSGGTSSCLADTRVQILNEIERWGHAELGDTSPSVFWLSGLAGTGKSTIARTVCERFAAQPMVCASFFFSRQTPERRDPSRVACSLAFQLAMGDDAMRGAICKVIEDNLDVATRSITEQIQLLLAESLHKCASQSRPFIIVLDALDECDKRQDVEGGSLLPALVAAIRRPGTSRSVRLFITSRGETSIRFMFDKLKREAAHEVVQLHEIEHSIVRSDILHYLQYRLRAIPEKLPDLLPSDWPQDADLVALADRAGVLFVYAATLVRFIDSDLDDPMQQLCSILEGTVSDSKAAYHAVDELYLQILDRAVRSQSDASHTHCQRLRDVLGSLILVREPMLADCLARLIDLKASDVTLLLRQLTAVLIVPATGPATIFHPSFPDFIVDSNRCTDERFRVDAQSRHTILACRCLKLMNGHLKRDICNIQDPRLLNSEVPDFPRRIREAVPPELAYACQYWGAHVSFATPNDPLIVAELSKFAREKMLYWIEVLSLLGILHSAYATLSAAMVYSNHATPSTETASLLNDANYMVREFYPAIREAALHIYYSALPMMSQSALLNYTKQDSGPAVRLLSARREGWHEQLQHVVQVSGHKSSYLRFLCNGTRLLCTTLNRHMLSHWTIYIWDTATGEVLLCSHNDINPFKHPVSVAISPDETQLVSNSAGQPSRVWCTETGQCLLELHYSHYCDNPSSILLHIAFSTDGRRVVGSSCYSVLHLWDAHSGKLEATFGEPGQFKFDHIFFSANGEQIICLKKTCIKETVIWNTQTMEPVSSVIGGHISNHDPRPVPRSYLFPCMNYIGQLFSDYYVRADLTNTLICRIWSTSGMLLQTVHLDQSQSFRGYMEAILPCDVSFSQNVAIMCLRDRTETVYLWNLQTGALILSLKQPGCSSVVLSDDGSKIVLCSNETSSISIWDTHDKKLICQLTAQLGNVCISKNNRQLACHSPDGSIRMWNISDNGLHVEAHNMGANMTSISISDDGSRIVTASMNHLITVWNTFSGTPHTTMDPVQRRAGPIPPSAVAISGDHSRVISAHFLNLHDTGFLCLWDCVTGKCIDIKRGGTGRIDAVTMSADGKHAVTLYQHSWRYSWAELTVWDLKVQIPDPDPWEQNPPPAPPMSEKWCAYGYVKLSADGQHAATQIWAPHRREHLICVYDISTRPRHIIASLQIPLYCAVRDLKYYGDLLCVAIVEDSKIYLLGWSRSSNYAPTTENLPLVIVKDADPSSHWMWSVSRGTAHKAFRVCWIPPERHLSIGKRDYNALAKVMAIEGVGGQLTILDFTAVQSWAT